MAEALRQMARRAIVEYDEFLQDARPWDGGEGAWGWGLGTRGWGQLC